jgi:hypothetical protein
MIETDGPVCAWCDVYNRVERNTHDEHGRVICSWTVCAYCGRTELNMSKQGRQTPIPKRRPTPPPGYQF